MRRAAPADFRGQTFFFLFFSQIVENQQQSAHRATCRCVSFTVWVVKQQKRSKIFSGNNLLRLTHRRLERRALWRRECEAEKKDKKKKKNIASSAHRLFRATTGPSRAPLTPSMHRELTVGVCIGDTSEGETVKQSAVRRKFLDFRARSELFNNRRWAVPKKFSIFSPEKVTRSPEKVTPNYAKK